jgi:hypothetical protein
LGLSHGVRAIQGGSGRDDCEYGDGGEGSNILELLSGVLGSLNGVFSSRSISLFIYQKQKNANK